ncbi:helix-turn-helix domain-containing protein [Tsukamurella serpentis]
MPPTTRTSPPTERVLAVLDVLAAQPTRALGLSELSRRAEVSKPTCLGIVTTLVARGHLIRDAEAGYRLGPALVPVGRAARRSLRAAPVGGTALAALSRRFGAPASISAVLAGRIVVLDVAGLAPGMRPGDGFGGGDGALMYRLWDADFETDDPLLQRVRADGYLVEAGTEAGARVRRALTAGEAVRAGELGEVIGALAARVLLPQAGGGRYPVSVISAPVRDPDGRQTMVASLHLDGEFSACELAERGGELMRACRRIARR